MMRRRDIDDLADLAQTGSMIEVHVTPGALQASLRRDDSGAIRIRVNEPADEGRATRAAQQLLAQALGVAPSSLVLKRGAKSRNKVFLLDD